MNPEATSWIAFGVATVTMVGGLVKSMIDSRDKRLNTEQAVKVALLENDVKETKANHQECLDHHEETKRSLEDCRKGHEHNDKRLSALEAIITPSSTPMPPELKHA